MKTVLLEELLELFVAEQEVVRKPKKLSKRELKRICPAGCAEVGKDTQTGEFGIYCKAKQGDCDGQSIEHNSRTGYGVIIDGKEYIRPKCMLAPNYQQKYYKGAKK